MNKLLFLLLILSAPVCAQQYIGEAALPAVPADGFYKIPITHKLVPYLNTALSNVRIVGSANQEVPYIHQSEAPVSFTQQFRNYEIVEKRIDKNCCTALKLKNTNEQAINNISLLIKNADVTKEATLLGSDDNKNWYALKQHIFLSAMTNENGTSEIKIIDFPLSNYSYYLLQINDSSSAPLNILSAGYYETTTANGAYTAVPITFQQTDSVSIKQTYVTIDLTNKQIIDRLAIQLEGPPYYLRNATLYQQVNRKNKKGETVSQFEVLDYLQISSKHVAIVDLHQVKTQALQIVIENNDNPPLKVTSAEAFQLNRYLVAWMKKGAGYSIKIGNQNMVAPLYDLEFFKESIDKSIPVLSAAPFTVFTTEKNNSTPTIFTSKNLIWVAIVIILIVFGFLAVRMVKDTSHKNETSE